MTRDLDELWQRHDAAWRDPAQVASQWPAADADPSLLRHRQRGDLSGVLADRGLTLLATREYEHILIAVGGAGGRSTYMTLPHPSGLAVDRRRQLVHVASTRNPTQVFTFAPVTGVLERTDTRLDPPDGRPLVPVRSRFYPGSLYIHDLAFIGGELHANAVAHNAIVRLPERGGFERVWWPRAIETEHGPDFSRNYLQLNSIAAGPDLSGSFFSASAARISARRPGHRNFPVDGRGVVFDGATREPVAAGLTRPHSARLHRGRLWVANSGYGELGVVEDGRFEPVARLPGWTRGLCFDGDLAFVATSRVIPRFRQYAPGLDLRRSVCGVHAVDIRSGAVVASLIWPSGNQLFAVELVPAALTTGFPAHAAGGRRSGVTQLFYGFKTDPTGRNQ